jgi:Zn-dependent peptidase ImmA (M78 family)
VAEVAQGAKLPEALVLGLEAGTESLTAARLQLLARGLGAELNWLLSEEPGADLLRNPARFRALSGTSVELGAKDRRQLALAAEVGRISLWLAELLEEETRLPPSRQQPVAADQEHWRQGYALGQQQRLRMSPEPAPLQSVQGLLEAWGVHVAFISFESTEVEAAALWEPRAAPVVLLNESSRVRLPRQRRAVLAHELCHLLVDASEDNGLVTSVTRNGPSEDPLERRANAFAPAFLAPPPWLEHLTDERGEADAMAWMRELTDRWGFTPEAAAWHYRNVHRCSESQAAELKRSVKPGAFSLREDPPRLSSEGLLEPAPLLLGLVGDRVLRAAQRGLLTRGRALELLSIA